MNNVNNRRTSLLLVVGHDALRTRLSALLREWERTHRGRVDTIFKALSDVVPTHLMDRSLYDFAAIRATGRPEPDGDLAFDQE